MGFNVGADQKAANKIAMFLAKNYKAIILTLFVILSELVYLPFVECEYGIINGELYNWGDIIYSFWTQLGYVNLLPAIVLFISTKNNDSKCIYLGLIVWNIIEVIQELNLILKLNINLFLKYSSLKCDILQITFIILVVIFARHGFKKWNTSSL